jgi:alpha-L-fucosidase
MMALVLLSAVLNAQPLRPIGPTPTPSQQKWQELEFYLFMHSGPNTFTNKEWGHGDEPEDIFNPTALDCKQWARVAKASGAKGIIITAKHHDGFCLWPSEFSKHTVRESKWKDGKGDVLKDLSQACKEAGLLFGIYISPWDRNHPDYGTPAYNQVYMNTMKEAVGKYGPIFEMWWDGANGEGPNGKKQVYDFRAFENTIRSIAPNAIVFSDIGPDIRWVGNESGYLNPTNWNLLDTAGFQRGAGGPSTDTLNIGNKFGKNWIPGECDVSIRPGWFYHKEEDANVKTGTQLMDLYFKSVGRGGNLLLNVPPDRRGLIHENDSAALMEFKKLRDQFNNGNLIQSANISSNGSMKSHLPNLTKDGNINSFWAAAAGVKEPELLLDFKNPTTINTLVLEEYLALGQRISSFVVEAWNQDHYEELAKATTMGRKRILQFKEATTSKLRIRILDSKATPLIREIAVYNH